MSEVKLESKIDQAFAAWVKVNTIYTKAGIVLIGVGAALLFAKLAHEQGWLDKLPEVKAGK